MIRHVLLISFQSSVTQATIDDIQLLFEEIPQKIEGVLAVEWGLNNSPEGLNKGYTHCVVMTFSDEAGRQNYLPHPEHVALKAVLIPALEDIVVFDYCV